MRYDEPQVIKNEGKVFWVPVDKVFAVLICLRVELRRKHCGKLWNTNYIAELGEDGEVSKKRN